MKATLHLGTILILLLLAACADDNATTQASTTPQSEETQNISQTEPASDPPASEAAGSTDANIVFSRVDNLRLREAPNTDSKVVGGITEGEPLIATGEKTAHTEKITLRGVEYNEPWIKVKTQSGQTGWVYGGAVGAQLAAKGGKSSGGKVIDIPHFGKYDLSAWKKVSDNKSSGGDAEHRTQTYVAGDLSLVITNTEVGEYGYGINYILKDSRGKIKKVRDLMWMAGDDGYNLTENVYDFESMPPTQHTRTQPFQQHFYQIKPRPETVRGSFQETTLDKDHAKELQKNFSQY